MEFESLEAWKSWVVARLAEYVAKNQRERYLVQVILINLGNTHLYNLYEILKILRLIENEVGVSDDFKKFALSLIPKASDVARWFEEEKK